MLHECCVHLVGVNRLSKCMLKVFWCIVWDGVMYCF